MASQFFAEDEVEPLTWDVPTYGRVGGMSEGVPVYTGNEEVFRGKWLKGPICPPDDRTGTSLSLQSTDKRGRSFSANTEEAVPQFDSQKWPSRKDFWEELASL